MLQSRQGPNEQFPGMRSAAMMRTRLREASLGSRIIDAQAALRFRGPDRVIGYLLWRVCGRIRNDRDQSRLSFGKPVVAHPAVPGTPPFVSVRLVSRLGRTSGRRVHVKMSCVGN